MTTMPQRSMTGLAIGLVLLGLIARLMPHPWNATPLAAIALFAGTYLPKRWAMLLPLAIVAASDVVRGWHSTIPFTWGAFALIGMLGWWVRQNAGAGRIVGGTLAGSVLFFVLTNFGVWAVGELYPRTLAGLWECYAAAVPFFRGTLMGDALYATALFGTYALANRPQAARQHAGG